MLDAALDGIHMDYGSLLCLTPWLYCLMTADISLLHNADRYGMLIKNSY